MKKKYKKPHLNSKMEGFSYLERSSSSRRMLIFSSILFFFATGLSWSQVDYGSALESKSVETETTGDYIEVPNTGTGVLGDNSDNSEWTIELWFKDTQDPADSESSFKRIVAKNSDISVREGYTLFENSDGTVSAYHAVDDNSWISVTGTTTINDGEWHHIAMTYQTSHGGSRIRLYIDGESQGVSDLFTPEHADSNINLRFFNSQHYGNSRKGRIDEVRIWTDARIYDDIVLNRYRDINSIEPNLLAYYKMSNGSGTTLTDDSVNSFDATIHGNIVWVTSDLPQLYTSGNGTNAAPFQVTNWEDLKNIEFFYNSKFELANNLSSATSDYTGLGDSWNPIQYFEGTFDGNSHTISDLTIASMGEEKGLFEKTNYAIIRNLGVVDASIIGINYLGILIGYAQNTDVEKCFVTGNIDLRDSDEYAGSTGGLVGYASNSTFTNSYAKVSIRNFTMSIQPRIGGFIGSAPSSTVSKCYSASSINSSAGLYVNPFLGRNAASTTDVSGSFFNSTLFSGEKHGAYSSDNEAMKNASHFVEYDWDFTASGGVWGINETDNEGYPFLRHQGFTSDHIWLGTVPQDGIVASNWSENSIPDASSAVRIVSADASNNSNLEISDHFEVGDLEIEKSSARLIVLPNASLKVNNDIINDGEIKFKSDATGDAYFDEFNGVINGDGVFYTEKYYPNKRAFRMVSSPVNGGSIFDNWQDQGNKVQGEGTHITGETGTVGDYNSVTGIDYTSLGNPSLFTFNKNNGWEAVVNTKTTNLQAGVPYRLMIRGDRNIDLNNNEASSETTLFSEGTPLTGSQIFTPEAVGSTNLYSFIANPYQSRINVKELLDHNSDADNIQFWVWDPTANARGAFVVIDELTTATGMSTPFTGATKFIEPGQAFFIKVTSPPIIEFTESMKDVSNTQAKSTAQSNEKKQILFELLNDKEQAIDAIRLRFSTDGDNSIDAYDAGKLSNLDENLASVNEDQPFTIQSRQLPEDDEVIPLFTNNWRESNYSFRASIENLEDTEVYVIDNYLGTETHIKHGDVYAFSVDASVADSKSTSRFELKFSKTTLGLDDLEQNKLSLFPNPAQDVIHIQTSYSQATEVEISLYNLLGQKVKSSKQLLESSAFQMEVSDLQKGVYILELTDQEGNQHSKKFIKQ